MKVSVKTVQIVKLALCIVQTKDLSLNLTLMLNA